MGLVLVAVSVHLFGWLIKIDLLPCPSPSSAKSRIKGTLRIYHAFIRETREQSEPSSGNSDGEWEHVEATNAGETSAQPVSVLIPFEMQILIVWHSRFAAPLSYWWPRCPTRWMGRTPGCQRAHVLCESHGEDDAMG